MNARTKATLAAAKARGVKLGTYSQILVARRIEEADSYAKSVENDLRNIIQGGAANV